ncbi:MAG TPA: carboxypeptidase-like regulatory domain-containing protein [Bacteroidia bacterium]|jgi:hypothetical protein|nr:carboxypeptidase-like regulatory domain-containing protein [Bacteroidia bacterium]
MKRTLIFILNFLVGLIASAQQQISIKGKVISSDTHTPLLYCPIQIKNSAISTTTNEDGVFELHCSEAQKNDLILISYIGYEQYSKKLSDILNENTNEFILQSKPFYLQEIVVQYPLSAEEILNNVYKSAKSNFNLGNYKLDGFFRSYLKTDNIYDRLIEGDISLVSTGFTEKKLKWNGFFICANEVRASRNTGDMRDVVLQHKKGVNNLEEIITIHEHLLDDLKKRKTYDAILIEKTEYLDTNKIITLKLSSNSGRTTTYVKVNAQNWAIEELLYCWNAPKTDDQFYQSSIYNGDSIIPIKLKNSSDSCLIKYKNYNGKYYLSFFKRRYKKEVFEPTKTYKFQINTEYATNNINFDTQKISHKNLIDRTDNLYKQVCEKPYHAEFWKNYNLILDNADMEQIRKQINAKANIDEQFNDSNKYPTGSAKGKK